MHVVVADMSSFGGRWSLGRSNPTAFLFSIVRTQLPWRVSSDSSLYAATRKGPKFNFGRSEFKHHPITVQVDKGSCTVVDTLPLGGAGRRAGERRADTPSALFVWQLCPTLSWRLGSICRRPAIREESVTTVHCSRLPRMR